MITLPKFLFKPWNSKQAVALLAPGESQTFRVVLGGAIAIDFYIPAQPTPPAPALPPASAIVSIQSPSGLYIPYLIIYSDSFFNGGYQNYKPGIIIGDAVESNTAHPFQNATATFGSILNAIGQGRNFVNVQITAGFGNQQWLEPIPPAPPVAGPLSINVYVDTPDAPYN
jgi:hypothetical protein